MQLHNDLSCIEVEAIWTSCCRFRDLIKWCTRLERHAVERCSKLTTDLLFTEAIDCFCANLPMSGGHVELAKGIGKFLNFSHTEVLYVSFAVVIFDSNTWILNVLDIQFHCFGFNLLSITEEYKQFTWVCTAKQ